MSKRFETAKARYLSQGFSSKQAATMAAFVTGETDGSISVPDAVNTSQWTEDDWYQNNLRLGMSEDEARFSAAVAVGAIDIDEPGVDY